jgi:Flp pilus assembly protein TadG
MTMRAPGNFIRADSGATAVEFAMVSSAFLTLVMGVCYLGLMLFNNMTLEWAVTRASRLAEINKAVTLSDISQAINGYLASSGLPNATVTYSSSVSGGLRSATIAAGFQQTFVVPMISTFQINFSSNITVPQPG